MDPSSAPLADYFWIAGVDALSYGQHLKLNPDTGEKEVGNGAPLPVESTIDEDKALDTSLNHVQTSPRDSLVATPGLDLHGELGFSMVMPSAEQRLTMSNRSSATIRPIHANGVRLSDHDFDKALRKFTSERDSFLDELSFSAGTVIPGRPINYSRTLRIANEDTNGIKSGNGSIRRHFSRRDLNSMKRQPSTARAGEQRTLSWYCCEKQTHRSTTTFSMRRLDHAANDG